MTGEIPQVRACSKDDIDPWNGGNLFIVFNTDGSFNHNDHHHVLIGDLAVVASPQRSVLTVTLAAPALGWILGPLHRGPRLLHSVHRGNNNSDGADVRSFLDIALR